MSAANQRCGLGGPRSWPCIATQAQTSTRSPPLLRLLLLRCFKARTSSTTVYGMPVKGNNRLLLRWQALPQRACAKIKTGNNEEFCSHSGLFSAPLYHKPLIIRVVRREGIEPSTNWLKANCSTAELPARVPKIGGRVCIHKTAQCKPEYAPERTFCTSTPRPLSGRFT